jgi:expansin (peptidoglycan-binding protein)
MVITVLVSAGMVMFGSAAQADVPVPGTVQIGRATINSLGDSGLGNCSFPMETIPDRLYTAVSLSEYAHSGGCGSYLDVTGPTGTVRVIIADRCYECEVGHLDMSPESVSKIGPLTGVIPISYQAVRDPALPGPLKIRVQTGSSPYWVAFLVINHGNPLSTVEYQAADGTWVGLTRQEYNYWQKPDGAGPGPFTLRITDVYGHQAVADNVQLTPEVIQDTGVWMYPQNGSEPGGSPTPSPPSTTPPTPTPTASAPAPTPPSSATCSAVVEIGTMWPGGYQATVSVRNLGPASSPWTVAWTLPAGITLVSGWNAVLEQHGTTVTASALPWNTILDAGGTLTIGFNVDGMPNPPPSAVTLNGTPCQA